MKMKRDGLKLWAKDTLAKLQQARDTDNAIGWFGFTPSGCFTTSYFYPGCSNARQAIGNGMPREAAIYGCPKTPSQLLTELFN